MCKEQISFILWWRIMIFCDTTVQYFRELFYFINKREERERERLEPRETFTKGLERSPRRGKCSRSRPTRSQRMVLNPFTFLPPLHDQTRLVRYPSRAAAFSFVSSRRHSHPRRRMLTPVPEESSSSDRQQQSEHPSCKTQNVFLVKTSSRFNNVSRWWLMLD